jgi:hypothetical protein
MLKAGRCRAASRVCSARLKKLRSLTVRPLVINASLAPIAIISPALAAPPLRLAAASLNTPWVLPRPILSSLPRPPQLREQAGQFFRGQGEGLPAVLLASLQCPSQPAVPANSRHVAERQLGCPMGYCTGCRPSSSAGCGSDAAGQWLGPSRPHGSVPRQPRRGDQGGRRFGGLGGTAALQFLGIGLNDVNRG